MYLKNKTGFFRQISRALAVFVFITAFPAPSSAGNGPDQTISIASWNIRIFSDGSRDQTELTAICSILQMYDFIAVQELRDTHVLDRALTVLDLLFDKSYEYVVSPPLGRGVKERYAFLYDAGRIFWKDVSFGFADPEDRFIREPFGALFQAGEFDFYAVTVHSIFGDSKGQRRAEAALLDDVYRAVQDRDSENDVLLFGDFNLPPDDRGFAELQKLPGIFPLNTTMPTTIHDSLYDNIWMQRHYCGEFTGEWGVFPFDELLYGNDDKAASLAVSDHRPLWARFDTAGPDDD